MTPATRVFAAEIDAALDRLDLAALAREYLLDDVRRLEPGLNRNYIPRHKKGGSVSHYAIADEGPALLAFSHSERFRRFLSGLVQDSSSRLQCRLHGDKVYHGVNPSQEGDRRVAYTMEYVTSQEMGRVQRLFSNPKDAFTYFGNRALLRGRRARGSRARVHSEP